MCNWDINSGSCKISLPSLHCLFKLIFINVPKVYRWFNVFYNKAAESWTKKSTTTLTIVVHSKEVNNVYKGITFIKCYYSFYVVITIAKKLLHRHVFSIIKYFSNEFRKYIYIFWIWVWNGLRTNVEKNIWKIMETCFANESRDVIVLLCFSAPWILF